MMRPDHVHTLDAGGIEGVAGGNLCCAEGTKKLQSLFAEPKKFFATRLVKFDWAAKKCTWHHRDVGAGAYFKDEGVRRRVLLRSVRSEPPPRRRVPTQSRDASSSDTPTRSGLSSCSDYKSLWQLGSPTIGETRDCEIGTARCGCRSRSYRGLAAVALLARVPFVM
ncbi:hypothetical protein MRX96_007615 [Rhipicephalus microplus]